MNLNELFLKEGPQTVSFCWGRFQPPHRAHGELFNKLKEVGTYDYWICASQSTGPKDPLDYATKMKFIRLQHPKLAQHVLEDTSIKQVFDAVTAIYNKYDPKTAESLTLVFVGDKTRVGQFVPSFQKYNGVQGKHGYYKFGMITGATTSRDVDSDADAGISDPNQDMSQISPDNISGSLVRNLAATNQFEKFATTVSKTGAEPWVKELYAALGGGAPKQGVAENYHSDLMKQTYAKFFKPAPPKTVLAVKKFLSDVIISLGTAQDNDYNDNDKEISWEQDLSDVREAYSKLRSNTSPNWFDIADAVLSYDTEFRESMLEWAEEELGSKLVDFLWDEVWEAKHKISRSDGSYNIDVDSGQEVTPHKPYDPEKDPPKTPRNIEWKVMINGEQKIKFGGVSNNQEAAMKVATNWARNHGYEREVQAGKIKVVQVQQGVAEGVDIGQEWMSDTELDQYVPERLQQQWRELLGYDQNGNPSALWANLTGGYEPDVNDPQHRALMVKVANKWFTAKKIPNVKFFDVKDADDELEWLVQIGQQGVAEGTSIESTLRAVINDIGEPVTNVYDTMKFQAKKYMENHGELDRGFRMVAAGIGGRWVQSMYVGRLQNELYDLCKYNTRRTVELQQFLRGVEADGELEMKRSFGSISNELPRILAKLGQHLNAPQLTKNANRWMQNKAAYEEYIANLELEDDYDEPAVAKSPKNPAIGQQRSQVEDIVNDILSKLPKKIAGDIRNAIARSPNKLQALQAELKKHGQKSVAEATFKKSPYGRTAASQKRAKELLNPPKPPEPKKDEKGVEEGAERCPQCGMVGCTCPPGKCKCKPVAGWIPKKVEEHKKGVKAMKYTVKARNPVAKNAMSTIGGGGAGAHKDKKKASKQGDHKHKKQLVDLGESWNIEMSKVVSKLWK